MYVPTDEVLDHNIFVVIPIMHLNDHSVHQQMRQTVERLLNGQIRLALAAVAGGIIAGLGDVDRDVSLHRVRLPRQSRPQRLQVLAGQQPRRGTGDGDARRAHRLLEVEAVRAAAARRNGAALGKAKHLIEDLALLRVAGVDAKLRERIGGGGSGLRQRRRQDGALSADGGFAHGERLPFLCQRRGAFRRFSAAGPFGYGYRYGDGFPHYFRERFS